MIPLTWSRRSVTAGWASSTWRPDSWFWSWSPSPPANLVTVQTLHLHKHTNEMKQKSLKRSVGLLLYYSIYRLYKCKASFALTFDLHLYSSDAPCQINKVLSHPTLPITVTAQEDRHIRFFDNTTGNRIEHCTRELLFMCIPEIHLYFGLNKNMF